MVTATSDDKIRRTIIAGLIRAIASAETKAAIARAWSRDAEPAEKAARSLRAELARVEERPQGISLHGTAKSSAIVSEASACEMKAAEDAEPAAQAIMDSLARPRGDVRVQDLRRELAGIEEADPIRWPGADPAEVEASPHEPTEGGASGASASPEPPAPVPPPEDQVSVATVARIPEQPRGSRPARSGPSVPIAGDMVGSGRVGPKRERRVALHSES